MFFVVHLTVTTACGMAAGGTAVALLLAAAMQQLRIFDQFIFLPHLSQSWQL